MDADAALFMLRASRGIRFSILPPFRLFRTLRSNLPPTLLPPAAKHFVQEAFRIGFAMRKALSLAMRKALSL